VKSQSLQVKPPILLLKPRLFWAPDMVTPLLSQALHQLAIEFLGETGGGWHGDVDLPSGKQT
jgi:hypothetical protein